MVEDGKRLNQQMTNGMDVSTMGIDSGLELKNGRLECIKSVPVKDLAVLDEAET